MPFFSPPWDSLVYWALDIETGGLEPGRDPILAVGMVPIREGRIRFGEAFRSFVKPDPGSAIGRESVRAHQLVLGEVRDAPTVEQILPEIDRRLAEGVLLVHHRAVDVPFLRRAHRRAGIPWPSPPIVDTVDLLVRLAHRRRFRSPMLEGEVSLNLGTARTAHGLPTYQAHDALTDAVATAELFLVLRHELGAKTLRDLR